MVKKGFIRELYLLYKKFNLPWENFSTWLKHILGANIDPKSLAAIHTKRANFLKMHLSMESLLQCSKNFTVSLDHISMQLNPPANSCSYGAGTILKCVLVHLLCYNKRLCR